MGYEHGRKISPLGHLVERGYLHVFAAIINALFADDIVSILFAENGLSYKKMTDSKGKILPFYTFGEQNTSLFAWWNRDNGQNISSCKANQYYIQALNTVAQRFLADKNMQNRAPYELGAAFASVFQQNLLNKGKELINYDQLSELISTKVQFKSEQQE